MTATIYALVDPTSGDVRYIGKSIHGIRRAKSHALPSLLRLNENRAKCDWIRGLKSASAMYEIRILETIGRDSADDAECFWISQGRGLGWPLLNETKGGPGMSGHRHTEDTRAHLAEIRGTPEYRAAQSARITGIKRSAETRALLSIASRNRPPVSAETRAKMSAAHKGKTKGPAHRAAIGAANSRRVVSEESRARMSAGQLARQAKARQ